MPGNGKDLALRECFPGQLRACPTKDIAVMGDSEPLVEQLLALTQLVKTICAAKMQTREWTGRLATACHYVTGFLPITGVEKTAR